MGQYYLAINKTKKQYIAPHALDAGAKLLEFSCTDSFTIGLCLLLANSNGRGGGDVMIREEYDSKTGKYKPLTQGQEEHLEVIKEVAGRWAGDQIVIQGDYAEPTDPGYVSEEELKGYNNISSLVLNAIRGEL